MTVASIPTATPAPAPTGGSETAPSDPGSSSNEFGRVLDHQMSSEHATSPDATDEEHDQVGRNTPATKPALVAPAAAAPAPPVAPMPGAATSVDAEPSSPVAEWSTTDDPPAVGTPPADIEVGTPVAPTADRPGGAPAPETMPQPPDASPMAGDVAARSRPSASAAPPVTDGSSTGSVVREPVPSTAPSPVPVEHATTVDTSAARAATERPAPGAPAPTPGGTGPSPPRTEVPPPPGGPAQPAHGPAVIAPVADRPGTAAAPLDSDLTLVVHDPVGLLDDPQDVEARRPAARSAASPAPATSAPGPSVPASVQAVDPPVKAAAETVRTDVPAEVAASEQLDRAELQRVAGRTRLGVDIATDELGRVRIEAVGGRSELQLNLTSDDPQGRALLGQRLPELREQMREAGLDVGSFDLDSPSSGRSDTGDGVDGSARDGTSATAMDRAPGAPRDAADDPTDDPDPLAASGTNGLDVRL